MTLWGVKWRSKNKLDGYREHLIYDWKRRDRSGPVMFRTRKEARQFIQNEYGYIKDRKDLQIEPHGWKMPIPVKVKVEELS